jgi:hypothetical protein
MSRIKKNDTQESVLGRSTSPVNISNLVRLSSAKHNSINYMTIRRSVVLSLCVLLIAAFLIARLYFPLIGPRSARELVATFSGLPVPLRVQSEQATDQCSGMLCQDYYARALIRLPEKPCARAITAAKSIGYAQLPLPDDLSIPYEAGQPSTPKRGLYRYLKPRPQETRFSWIDTDDCRVYVEYAIE